VPVGGIPGTLAKVRGSRVAGRVRRALNNQSIAWKMHSGEWMFETGGDGRDIEAAFADINHGVGERFNSLSHPSGYPSTPPND
jgi:hypothetical protein